VNPNSFLDSNWILAAMARIGKATVDGRSRSIREGYYRTLGNLQPVPSLFVPSNGGIRIVTRVREPAVAEVLAHFTAGVQGQGQLLACEGDAQFEKKVAEAYGILAGLSANIPLALDLLVHTVLFFRHDKPSYGGASLADVPGVVWIRPDPEWGASEFAECVLHEAVHQSVFLFDLALVFLRDAAYHDSARVPSAVRSIYPSGQEPLRLYWAAFHAAIVAWWLDAYFTYLGQHRRAWQFREALQNSLPFLWEREDFLTAHGRAVLDALAG